MTKLETQLIEKLFAKKKSRKKIFFKGRDLQIFPENFQIHNLRMFKAVYAHFAKNKAKSNPKQAMEEAKSAYESMKEIQDRLNKAYNDFINSD